MMQYIRARVTATNLGSCHSFRSERGFGGLVERPEANTRGSRWCQGERPQEGAQQEEPRSWGSHRKSCRSIVAVERRQAETKKAPGGGIAWWPRPARMRRQRGRCRGKWRHSCGMEAASTGAAAAARPNSPAPKARWPTTKCRFYHKQVSDRGQLRTVLASHQTQQPPRRRQGRDKTHNKMPGLTWRATATTCRQDDRR